MKEGRFKRKVKEACQNFSFKKLLSMKEKHKKGSNLQFKTLEISSYLTTNKLNVREAKLLFKIRSRMLDVRNNYKGKYMPQCRNGLTETEVLICQLCKGESDTQEHVLLCPQLLHTRDTNYGDLFSDNLNTVVAALAEYSKLWRERSEKIQNLV